MNDADRELLMRVLDEQQVIRETVAQLHAVIARVDERHAATAETLEEVREFLHRKVEDHSARLDGAQQQVHYIVSHRLHDRLEALEQLRWKLAGLWALAALVGGSGMVALARALILGAR